jgi:predicted DNA-binding WGR domain protein
LHTASLNHVGQVKLGDVADEKDADIWEFTKVLDPKTNVMIQWGTSGGSSTTNVHQFQKVEQKVRKDTGKKVEDKKIQTKTTVKK